MQFTAPVSIDEAVRILSSHSAEIPVLADTVVEVSRGWEGKGDFSVKRRWKAKRGWGKYTVVYLNGTLAAASDSTTAVNLRIGLDIMAYVAAAFAVLLLLAGLNARNGEILILCSIVIVLLFVFDAYVLYRVVDSLKRGRRP